MRSESFPSFLSMFNKCFFRSVLAITITGKKPTRRNNWVVQDLPVRDIDDLSPLVVLFTAERPNPRAHVSESTCFTWYTADRNSTFGARRSAFCVLHSAFGVLHSAFGVRQITPAVCSVSRPFSAVTLVYGRHLMLYYTEKLKRCERPAWLPLYANVYSTNHSPLAWRWEGQKVTLVAVIGGFRSDLSITRKTDWNFRNVSAGVLFSKVAYQLKWWKNLH